MVRVDLGGRRIIKKIFFNDTATTEIYTNHESSAASDVYKRQVNASSTRRHTAVLYPEGNSGMEWDVKIYPLSAVPGMERGTTVTGEGPGVFRLPQGPARTHSLEVTAEHDVPSVAVYDADDLGLSSAFEYGTSPATVDVEVGGGEQVVVVESQEKWSFRPAG